MSARDEMLALAERCEAATGPDRALDCEIAVAAAGYFETAPKWPGGPVGYGYIDAEGTAVWPGHDGDQLVPAYTASLDAAMTLVGYSNGRPHNLVIASAYGSAYIVPNDGASYGIHDPLKGEARAHGDDEIGRTARAVTAAALRARAALAGDA